MSENPVKQRNVDISSDRDAMYARGTTGKIAFLEKESYPGFPGLSWRPLKFVDIDASEKDGALCELETDSRIPVELVRADKTFSEVPLAGNLLFFIDQMMGLSLHIILMTQEMKTPRFYSKLIKVNFFVGLI